MTDKQIIIDDITYLDLCKKESSLILQKIICPYCGYVYSFDDSITYGMGDDCEDERIVNCLKCNKKIKVHSKIVEPRFWTMKVKDNNNDR